ncbi:hypothetical protein PFMG_04991 [Plasmodium falciparum IGH-CR14]|uniref:Uncharacterized protein n=1 Tax=Plasmodium falciparum IGH-CR14 TaxID=580059 RepID=A0A0L1IH62_PLAFA|nr:hypothetical protein PFMG_04991 [Plasmodium falciparum IGH-CR14]
MTYDMDNNNVTKDFFINTFKNVNTYNVFNNTIYITDTIISKENDASRKLLKKKSFFFCHIKREYSIYRLPNQEEDTHKKIDKKENFLSISFLVRKEEKKTLISGVYNKGSLKY